MVELTFVGLAALAWTMTIFLVIVIVIGVVLIFHLVRLEVRTVSRRWRASKAKKEMLERQARCDRAKEQQAKNEKFFADIQEIVHEL